MQPHEWALVAAIMENCWRGEWDDERSAGYFALLEEFDAADVERALHVLKRNGKPFIPAVSEIIAAIDSGTASGVPTWPEALRAIRAAIRRHGRFRAQLGLEQLDRAHPMVASFAGTYGWERLCGEPIDDADHGGAVLRRLEVAYDEHVERQRDRERNGLALQAVNRRQLSGPRRTNAAELLRGEAA